MRDDVTVLRDAALMYADIGWYVFPTRKDKTPWPHDGFKSATRDAPTIMAWWKENPDAGVGISLGPSKLTVIDFDPKNGADLESGLVTQLPRTYTVETGLAPDGRRGRHYYYKRTGDEWRRLGVEPGVDALGGRGYVIAPPSAHLSGVDYEIMQVEVLADEPEWFAEWREPALVKRIASELGGDGAIPSGLRNNHLARMAGAMRNVGFTADEIWTALSMVNEDRCDPPLAEGEVAAIASSIARYPAGQIQKVNSWKPTISKGRKL